MLQFHNALVPERDARCRDANAGGIGLDVDAMIKDDGNRSALSHCTNLRNRLAASLFSVQLKK